MRKNSKNTIKSLIIATICIICFTFNASVVNAENSLENELNKVIQSYPQEEISVEDGIALHVGESKDFSQYPNWKLSNDNVVKLTDGKITAIGEGTVFLSQKIGDKVYIVEIYVSQNKMRMLRSYSSNSINRDYYKVFVDAGHGGSDPGASGFGEKEAKLNLEIAQKVADKLKSKNIEVKMSRESDKYLGISERAKMANDYGADVFVSIHQNSASDENGYGIETLYHPQKQNYKPLAVDVQNNIILQTNGKDRGPKDMRDLGVLRESNMPSSLVECGFLTNKKENEKLKDPEYQEKLAIGIANGIEIYLKNNMSLGNEEVTVINTGVVVNTDSLNVRSGYGTNYPIIGKINKDEKVEIVESNNGWYKIKYNGNYGFVSAKYINLNPTEDKDDTTTDTEEWKDIQNHWAKSAINEFIDKGYINGYGDGTFRPEDNITRAEFIKVVNKRFGFTELGEQSFVDVSEDDWFVNDVKIAMKAGYITGDTDKNGNPVFRPNDTITREEMAKIVASITNISDSDIDKIKTFSDSSKVSNWAVEYMEGAIEHGYITGYSEDNTIRPKSNATRAESVVILQRIK